MHDLSRELFADSTRALEYLEDTAGGRNVVLVDIGGYFAPCLDTLVEKFSGRVLGVVEDTENGHQRYAALDHLSCPVVSVARSPLKDCEDHLVGRSIVFSTDALVRARGDILTSRNACVIGFGKVGRAIAQTLRAQDLRVTVHDTDPVKRVQAHSQGFRTSTSTAEALRDADLVLCATGNLALRHGDFAALRNGAYVASVTSSEDELELGSLHGLYQRTLAGEHLTRTRSPATTSTSSPTAAPSTSCTAPPSARTSISSRPRYSPPPRPSARAASSPASTKCPHAIARPSPGSGSTTSAGDPMPPSPDHIRATVEAYLTRYPSERDALAALFDALAGEDDPTSRKTFPTHATCSAIVIDGSSRVLHIQRPTHS